MAIYGDYELSRRLYKGPFTSFFLAKRIDGTGPETAAIRVLELPADMVEGSSRADWISRFLEAARIQQQVANKSSAWAKIHDFAENPEGAYYVTDYFPRALGDLIASRTPLPLPALLGLIEQVVDALIDLQNEKQRPHGNLKAANILMREKGPRAPNSVVLADPQPTAQLPKGASAAVDLQVLGELVYQIVMGREFTNTTLLPLEPTREWSKLGRGGSRLRVLCDYLLDASAPDRSLQAVKQRIAAMRTQGRAMRVVAVLVLVAASGGAVWYFRHHVSKVATLIPQGSSDQPTADTTVRETTRMEIAKPPPPPPPITKNDPPPPPDGPADLKSLMAAANTAPGWVKLFTIPERLDALSSKYCVRFKILADHDCDIILLAQSANGQVSLLLPNSKYLAVQAKAGVPLILPSSADEYFEIEPPYGEDVFKVIAVRRGIKLSNDTLTLADTGRPLASPAQAFRTDEWATAIDKVVTDKDGKPIEGAR